MFNFNKKNRLMSILLLFVMVFQIGFTSSSFAIDNISYKELQNYNTKEYTLGDLANVEACEKMTKEEILIFLELLNDPEVRELHNQLIKDCTGSDKVARMQWYQIPELMGGFWDGFYDELQGTVDGIKSMFRWDTYKAMLEFCGAIGRHEITLDDLKDMALDQLEPIEYVCYNSAYVFNPNSDVSDEEVREYGANLCKTIIMIIDAKNTLKELPESLRRFKGLLEDFGGVTSNVISGKKPEIDFDLDKIEDVVDEDNFVDDTRRLDLEDVDEYGNPIFRYRIDEYTMEIIDGYSGDTHHIINGSKTTRDGHRWENYFGGEKPSFDKIKPYIAKTIDEGEIFDDKYIGGPRLIWKRCVINDYEVWTKEYVQINGVRRLSDAGVNDWE